VLIQLKKFKTFIKTTREKLTGELPQGEAQDLFIDIGADHYGTQIPNAAFRLASGMNFNELYLGAKGDTIIGVNKDMGRIIKIGLKKNERKLLDVPGEAAVLKDLKQTGCISCPSIMETGTIDRNELLTVLNGADPALISDLPNECPYFVMEYVESAKKMRLADLILALLEQKSLGYYHGDLKPGNIRFDEKTGICVLVDYDQTVKLDPQIQALNASEFLRWCDQEEQRRYGMSSWRRHFEQLKEEGLARHLDRGALDLSQTTLFKRQLTTNSSSGVYQSIQHKDIFAHGSRDLKDRENILSQIEFSQNEKVLDIGCNAGLLCHYLHDRGCQVTGAELDPFMVTAAAVISRITGRDIAFTCFDLDGDDIPGDFDTIVLFSVLHHSSNIPANARKIAAACNRIIIECRLVESGKKPDQAAWQETSKWNYSSLEDLIHALQKLFPGFLLKRNHGIGGKKRYILEFVKKAD
jgi:2-polyprenyl-3-methyl-5-hydroxy-6-metoxy-1,4-benzoquinol methylase